MDFIFTCYHVKRNAKKLIKFSGPPDSALGQASGRVPNTNMHSTEGSNPIWMQAYENEWYKEEDSEV